MAEHSIRNAEVEGSTPSISSTKIAVVKTTAIFVEFD